MMVWTVLNICSTPVRSSRSLFLEYVAAASSYASAGSVLMILTAPLKAACWEAWTFPDLIHSDGFIITENARIRSAVYWCQRRLATQRWPNSVDQLDGKRHAHFRTIRTAYIDFFAIHASFDEHQRMREEDYLKRTLNRKRTRQFGHQTFCWHQDIKSWIYVMPLMNYIVHPFFLTWLYS